MGKEKGSILITVIFLMVILLIIAIGMTSIGTGGLEDSIIVGNDIANTQNKESIANSIQAGTDWGTGVDNWITDSSFATDVIGKNRLIMRIFIDKENNKTFTFSLPDDMTTPSAIYIVGLPKSGVTISNFSGASFSTVTATTAAVAYKSTSTAAAGAYSFRVSNSGTGEYTIFARVFCYQ